MNGSVTVVDAAFSTFVHLSRGSRRIRLGPLPVHAPTAEPTQPSEPVADQLPTLEALEALLKTRLEKEVLNFVTNRVRRLWPAWKAAVGSQNQKHPFMKSRRKKTVVV